MKTLFVRSLWPSLDRWGVTLTLILLSATAVSAVDQSLYQGMKWRNIGPFRGGRSVAATGIVSDPMTYYFGAVGGGVWKTVDGGEIWKNISDGQLKTSSVGAIAVAPSDANVVYVGMGEHSVRGVMTSHGDGVYRSTDAGTTWHHLGLEKTRAISRIRIHPNNPDLVYVATQGAPYGPTAERGVYRTEDGGASWELVHQVSETAGAADLSMDPTNPRVLYAAYWDHLRQPWEVRSGGPGSGFYKSTDGGDTWKELKKGLPELMGKVGIDVSPDPNRIYAIVEADPKGGLYRSDDGGDSWNLLNQDWSIRARAWYYMEVFADPSNPDVVWVLNAPTMKSIDGGKTFIRVQTPHGDNHDLWINPTDSKIMINANDGGANVSFNGGKTWSTQQNQPTAQFYRVNTDNRFPYWVYGGQQDNSSVAIASRTDGSGITWKDWYPAGGCESAYLAFDPDHPRYVYAGCYMGMIGEWDSETRFNRNVMAYPNLPAALASRDMKYRFNWNAPILVSQHDSSVIYHAANVLLRSSDRGVSWQEVSPDLTRDEDSKQGPGGSPITNEGAGGEIYNTILYLAESPRDPDTLWVGSDDGLVHVTRDGGANWKNITPEGLPEAMINAVELSPHQAGKAYLAVTRYKFNDFTPMAFKTTDFGATWQSITEGVPENSWMRVIREDPVRPGLLYGGTETGMFVSFDDGKQWESLQLNLPGTPITDLKIQTNDLVAATSGRSFWILDDLSPLQQIDVAVAESEIHLFEPRPAYRTWGTQQKGERLGQNPPAGAIIDFYLAEIPEDAVQIEILNSEGDLVRSFTGRGEQTREEESDDQPSADDRKPLQLKAGMNRMNWDLRHEPVTKVPGFYVFGSLQGRKAVPGHYTVRLTVPGAQTLMTDLEVLKDPRVEATQKDFVEQDQLVKAIDEQLTEIHKKVLLIRDVRDQVDSFLKRNADLTEPDSARVEATQLVERLNELEDKLIQKRTVDGQTVINFPARINQQYIFLRGTVDGAEGIVTQGARTRFRDLSKEWSSLQGELSKTLEQQVQAFNETVRKANIPAVELK